MTNSQKEDHQEKRDWTVKELADAAGLDPSRIRQILLQTSEIEGAYKRGFMWFIPDFAARRWLAGRSAK